MERRKGTIFKVERNQIMLSFTEHQKDLDFILSAMVRDGNIFKNNLFQLQLT